MVCAPPFHSTVPVLAVNVPAISLALPPIFNVLEPPLSWPSVLVQVPVNVCVNPVPRLSVPPKALIVSPLPLTLPWNVAGPAGFVSETVPVVVNPSMLCVDVVPAMVIAELPADKVPSLIKSPWKVKPKLDVLRVAPVLMLRGTFVLFPNCLEAFNVIVPVFLIITPPVAANEVIHSSDEAVLAVA